MPQAQGSGWLDFLEDRPEAAYWAYQNQWQTPAQKKYYQNQFGQIQNQYLGRLGQQILGGGTPYGLRFTDFLSQYPWAQQYMQLPPSMRGENPSQFAPPTRWMV